MNHCRILLAVLLLLMAGSAWSQGAFRFGPDERAGEWNLSIGATYQGSEFINGEGGSSVDLSDDWGFLFNVGYNINNHFMLSGEFIFQTPKYEFTAIPQDPNDDIVNISARADFFSGLFKGTWHILDGNFTPFIDASIGFTYIDSRVADGPPQTGCWWHPWWGYICSQFWNTYDDTRFNYGGGAGLRWDVSRGVFLRASYSILFIDASNQSDPSLDVGRFEVGWRF